MGRQTDRQTTEINRSPRERVGYQSRLAKAMMTSMKIRRTRCVVSLHAVLVAALLVVLSALVGTAGAERTLMQGDSQVSTLMAEYAAIPIPIIIDYDGLISIEASKAEVDDMVEANHEYFESELDAADAMIEEELEEVEELMASVVTSEDNIL